MSREEFIELCEQLRPFITRNALQIREHHPLKKNFAPALDFLKDAVSITMTANTFRLHQSTASKIVMEVCNVVVAYMAPKSITRLYKGTHKTIKMPVENSQENFI